MDEIKRRIREQWKALLDKIEDASNAGDHENTYKLSFEAKILGRVLDEIEEVEKMQSHQPQNMVHSAKSGQSLQLDVETLKSWIQEYRDSLLKKRDNYRRFLESEIADKCFAEARIFEMVLSKIEEISQVPNTKVGGEA